MVGLLIRKLLRKAIAMFTVLEFGAVLAEGSPADAMALAVEGTGSEQRADRLDLVARAAVSLPESWLIALVII